MKIEVLLIYYLIFNYRLSTSTNEWFYVLIFLFMNSEFGDTHTESLKRSVYTSLMKNYTLIISKNIGHILKKIEKKELCIICKKNEKNHLFKKIISPGLEKFEIYYSLPICHICNKEIAERNLLEWILTHPDVYKKLSKQILHVCIKSQYLLIKFDNDLKREVPLDVDTFLKDIDVENHLINLKNYKINELSFYMYRQLETFHYLKTEPHMWQDCQIVGQEIDKNGIPHPKYIQTNYNEITPYDDRKAEVGIQQAMYDFDDHLDLFHEHRNNCQICGTPILLNFRIKCDKLQREMVIGSECILNYNYLKGDEYARTGIQAITDYLQALFRSGISEFQKEVNEFFENNKSLLFEITQDYKKNIKFSDIVEKLTSKSHKKTIKRLIERAKILNIDIDKEFDKLIEDFIKMNNIKTQKNNE